MVNLSLCVVYDVTVIVCCMLLYEVVKLLNVVEVSVFYYQKGDCSSQDGFRDDFQDGVLNLMLS
jgi:hypothetical protein